jgi:hypothetical protein
LRTRPGGRFSAAWLLCRLTVLYIVFGMLKHVLHVTTLARWAWCSADPRHGGEAQRCATAALRVSTWFKFGDRNCLQRSLLLYRVLSHAGADPVLVIAFGRAGKGVQGHASVLVDRKLLFERGDIAASLQPVLRFGPEGRLLGRGDDAWNASPSPR